MMWARECTWATAAAIVFALPSQGAAQAAHGQPDAAVHGTVHRHHAGVFVGATTNLAADHTDPTVGLDYEYRLPVWHDRIGLAAFGEFTSAAHDEWILGGGTVLHPGNGLKLFAGGGLLFIDDEKGGGTYASAGTASAAYDNRHPLLRIGAGREFHAGRVSLSPTVFYDRVKGHGSLVYGVTVGTALGRRKSGEAPH